ncbi:MAG: hypothetical protein JSW25_01945 [Thermoplasmata archaeon]|nr:MAG: hypothetical protein JSW25_01945 [Thermoplasmata archaeon]
MPSTEKNVLFFRDLNLSISEWIPFGQNAISTLNGILDSVKGVRDSLLTGKVDDEPETSEFSMQPMFTRVILEDFDRYDWIKFCAHIEYLESVEQIRRMAVHVDKSGFVNYSLSLDSVVGREEDFPLDAVSAVLADVVEDTSMMMEALLTQFQRRCLSLVHGAGATAQRSKYIIAITSSLVPEESVAMKYQDGEGRQNEIDQLVGTSYEYLDLPRGEMLIVGTYGMIYVTKDPSTTPKVLSLYSGIRSLQMFQTIFDGRLRYLWDVIKDTRDVVLRLSSGERIGAIEHQLSQLSADIVLIDEICAYMRKGTEMMAEIWTRNRSSPEVMNQNLVKVLDIDRELSVMQGTIDDMVMVSKALVDEIQGIRDLLSTMAEKRMRDMNRLLTDNVQQGSEAQQIMLTNVRESRYTGAAVRILSALTAGYLGIKISDVIMEVMDTEGFTPPISDQFTGSFLHLAVGLTLWVVLAFAFFKFIKTGTARIKRQKMSKQFNLDIRFPIDKKVPPETIRRYIADKDVILYNVEHNGHRVGWHYTVSREDAKVLWVVTMSYDPRNEVLHYANAVTQDRKGDARYTADVILSDLVKGDVITEGQATGIREGIGRPLTGGAS